MNFFKEAKRLIIEELAMPFYRLRDLESNHQEASAGLNAFPGNKA